MEVEVLAMEIQHPRVMAVVLQGAVIRTLTRTSITVTEVEAAWTSVEASEEGQDMAMELEGLAQGSLRAMGTWVLLLNCKRA